MYFARPRLFCWRQKKSPGNTLRFSTRNWEQISCIDSAEYCVWIEKLRFANVSMDALLRLHWPNISPSYTARWTIVLATISKNKLQWTVRNGFVYENMIGTQEIGHRRRGCQMDFLYGASEPARRGGMKMRHGQETAIAVEWSCRCWNPAAQSFSSGGLTTEAGHERDDKDTLRETAAIRALSLLCALIACGWRPRGYLHRPSHAIFPFGWRANIINGHFPSKESKKGHSISITSETFSFRLLCSKLHVGSLYNAQPKEQITLSGRFVLELWLKTFIVHLLIFF